MRRVETRLAGLVLLEPRVHGDARGFLVESYREDVLARHGVADDFVQENHSRSSLGVLRGLHYAIDPGQAKLVRVARGRILDVAVDIRRGSPTFGRWEAVELDDATARSLYLPLGFAHGFVVLSDVADVVYKCSAYYDAAKERAISYADPDIAVRWPDLAYTISERDRAAPGLREVADAIPFVYEDPAAAASEAT